MELPPGQSATNSDASKNGGVMMRPPKVTPISEDAYRSQVWPQIREYLLHMLNKPVELSLNDTEECYRLVYNACTQRHQVLLYNDLLALVQQYLAEVKAALMQIPQEAFLFTITQHFTQFKRSCEVIGVTFQYLDRVYVIEKLSSSVTTLLLSMRNKMIFDTPEMKARIHSQLSQFAGGQFDPLLVQQMVKSLYGVSKEYVGMNPRLFAQYIPVLLPSRGVEQELRELNEFLARVRDVPFPNEHLELKRKYDETILY